MWHARSPARALEGPAKPCQGLGRAWQGSAGALAGLGRALQGPAEAQKGPPMPCIALQSPTEALAGLCRALHKGTVTQSDGLEDLVDDCSIKMRLRAGFVVSPACEDQHWQLLAPTVTDKSKDLKGDPSSS